MSKSISRAFKSISEALTSTWSPCKIRQKRISTFQKEDRASRLTFSKELSGDCSLVLLILLLCVKFCEKLGLEGGWERREKKSWPQRSLGRPETNEYVIGRFVIICSASCRVRLHKWFFIYLVQSGTTTFTLLLRRALSFI